MRGDRRREGHFETLAENIPDVIMRLDRERRCAYANPAVRQAFGVEPGELIGRLAGDFGLPADIESALSAAVESGIAAGHTAKARSEDRAFAHVRRVGLEPTTRGLRVHCSAS